MDTQAGEGKIQKRLVVVSPVFEDAQSAARLLEELAVHVPPDTYVVMVDDGSVNDVLTIEAVSKSGLAGEIVRLRRNLGHQKAIATALNHVWRCYAPDRVVVLDSDGEDRPSDIPRLLAKLDETNVNAVVASRSSRHESKRFKIFYAFYRALFHVLTGKSISFGNFCAMNASMLNRLVAMEETWLHLASSITVSRLPIMPIPISRATRYFGNSKMNFDSLVLHGFRSIMVHAEDVLVRVGTQSMFLAAFVSVTLFAAIALKVIGFATPGWYSVASGILILILLQIGALVVLMLMVSGLVRRGPIKTRFDITELVTRIDKTI